MCVLDGEEHRVPLTEVWSVPFEQCPPLIPEPPAWTPSAAGTGKARQRRVDRIDGTLRPVLLRMATSPARFWRGRRFWRGNVGAATCTRCNSMHPPSGTTTTEWTSQVDMTAVRYRQIDDLREALTPILDTTGSTGTRAL